MRSSNRTRLRGACAALALLCLMLPSFASASGEVVVPDADASWGRCRPATYGWKWGYITFWGGAGSQLAHGYWHDGCGGKGCDDTVHGTVYWDGGGSSSFYVLEMGKSAYAGKCVVRCTLDGREVTDRLGNVEPNKDAGVAFACEGWFHGFLGTPRRSADVFASAPDVEAKV